MPTYQPFDWYETPLYYDMVFDADTDQEADFLQAVHAAHGTSTGRRMLEPACGSGRLVAAMARRGYQVAGLDISPGALAFARQRLRDAALRARLIDAPMERFTLQRPVDIAHCLVSSFKYLRDEASAVGHLRCVASSLKPGGLYVLGIHVSDYADRSVARERWVAHRSGVKVVCNIQTLPAQRRSRTEQVRARIVATHDDGAVRLYETNWTFRTYGVRQLKSLIAQVPALERVANYTFDCDVNRAVPLDGSRLDNVVVLRRRA